MRQRRKRTTEAANTAEAISRRTAPAPARRPLVRMHSIPMTRIDSEIVNCAGAAANSPNTYGLPTRIIPLLGTSAIPVATNAHRYHDRRPTCDEGDSEVMARKGAAYGICGKRDQ